MTDHMEMTNNACAGFKLFFSYLTIKMRLQYCARIKLKKKNPNEQNHIHTSKDFLLVLFNFFNLFFDIYLLVFTFF